MKNYNGVYMWKWWYHHREKLDFKAMHWKCDPLACCKLCSQNSICMPRYEIIIFKHMWE
jgi:hypothetical protein